MEEEGRIARTQRAEIFLSSIHPLLFLMRTGMRHATTAVEAPVPVYMSVDADALVPPPPHIHHQVRHLRPHSRKVKQPFVFKVKRDDNKGWGAVLLT